MEYIHEYFLELVECKFARNGLTNWKTFLTNILKNIIWHLFAGESHQVVKFTVPYQHPYHGQPYARVDLNSVPESTLSPSQGLRLWPLKSSQAEIGKNVLGENSILYVHIVLHTCHTKTILAIWKIIHRCTMYNDISYITIRQSAIGARGQWGKTVGRRLGGSLKVIQHDLKEAVA